MPEDHSEELLAAIRARCAELESQTGEAARIQAERDRLIVAALEAGVSGRTIATAAGVIHQRVYQIADAARKRQASPAS